MTNEEQVKFLKDLATEFWNKGDFYRAGILQNIAWLLENNWQIVQKIHELVADFESIGARI